MSNPFVETPHEFLGRVAVIATMHRKEQAIAPLVESGLGVRTVVPENFNTDRWGTFSGEIQRPANQRTTARIKAEAALDHTGEALAIASEGSFGPHPGIPFMACDRELVLLLDRRHQLEIVGELLTTETNYRSQHIQTLDEALNFATAIGFPAHGLVIKAEVDPRATTVLGKGITTESDLLEILASALESHAHVRIETDMRALYNPTRMRAIATATEHLIQTLNHRCPQCHTPGFSVIRHQPGLPCGWCSSPTSITQFAIYACQRCQLEQKTVPQDTPTTADPMYCDICNP